MTACFIVRAQGLDPMIEDAFDRWYGEEHLPAAVKAFGALRAGRGWGVRQPPTHKSCAA